MGQYTRTSFLYDWIFPSDVGDQPEDPPEDPPETIDPYRIHFAHFGTGDGLETDLLLLNPQSDVAVEASVEVFSTDGTLLFPTRQVAAPPAGMVEWTLPVGDELETGSIVVTSPARLSGVLRFRYSDGGATAISATPLGSSFVVPVSNQAERIGLAIRNADAEALDVALKLGTLPRVFKTIPGEGQIAAFIDEYFPSQTDQELEGTLLVQTEPPEGEITVLALEFVGDSLVTLPATVLTTPIMDNQRKFSDGESTATIEYELDAAKGEAKMEAVIVNNGPTQAFTVYWRPIDADCNSTHPGGGWWSVMYEKSVSGGSTQTFTLNTSGDRSYPISANTKWLEWWVRTAKEREWENLEPKTKCEKPFRGL